jgi:hypothetical protein
MAPLAVLLVGSPTAEAKVRGISLSELVQLSDRIVVGTVSQIHDVSGIQVGEVTVLETLKGVPPAPVLYVLAQPTWICDITEVEVGQTALLFLSASDGKIELQELPPGDGDFKKAPRGFRKKLDRLRGVAPFFLVAQAGRGYMPVRSVDDQQLATVWTADVHLPSEVATLPGPEAKYSFIRSVTLRLLKDLISQAVVTEEAKGTQAGRAQ